MSKFVTKNPMCVVKQNFLQELYHGGFQNISNFSLIYNCKLSVMKNEPNQS